MLEIKRRHGPEDFETIATYQNGEFEGDEDFIEGVRALEGMPEEEVMRSLDGPRVIAFQVEEEDDRTSLSENEDEESGSEYVISLETEEEVDWLKSSREDMEESRQ